MLCRSRAIRRRAAALFIALSACATPKPEPSPTARSANPSESTMGKERGAPDFVSVPSDLTDGATFLAGEFARAERDDRILLLTVGAAWCEPCNRFHEALHRGELDRELAGARFVELDADTQASLVAAAECRSKMIPLIARVTSDGRCGPRRSEGAIKGDGAVGYLLPRVRDLLGEAKP